MNQGQRAEHLMAQVCLPEFQGELHQQGAFAFFWDFFVAQLWTINSIAAIRDVLVQSETVLYQTHRELADARASIERAKGSLEVAHIERAKELKEAGHRLEAIRIDQAEELEEAQRRTAAEAEHAQVVGEILDVAQATIGTRDLQINSYTFEVKAAELWAVGAEVTTRVASARAAEWEAAAHAAKGRAATVEGRSTATEERTLASKERAVRAMDNFRSSSAFEEELVEASASTYLLGFQDGRDKVG